MNLIEDEESKVANIYIGDAQDCDVEYLDEHGIDSVINLCEYRPDARLVKSFCYTQFRLRDGSAVPFQFKTAVDTVVHAIERGWFEDEKVLVHCGAGQSRSAAVLATALAKYLRATHLRDYSFNEGLKLVHDARPSVNPHLALQELGEQYLAGDLV
jgi:protein tyrosine phosphatase